MKKIIFFISMMFYAQITFSSNGNLDLLCEEQGAKYGNGQGVDKISPLCFDQAVAANHSLAVVPYTSPDQFFIVAYKNIIYVKNPKEEYIAGGSSLLQEVAAISLDQKNQELVVLDASGDVLFFGLKYLGNVAPLRFLKNQDLHGSYDVVVNPDSDEIYVANLMSKSLFVFSRLANMDGPEERKFIEMKALRDLPFSKELNLGYNQELKQMEAVDLELCKIWIFKNLEWSEKALVDTKACIQE